jgi:hypothetical protein
MDMDSERANGDADRSQPDDNNERMVVQEDAEDLYRDISVPKNGDELHGHPASPNGKRSTYGSKLLLIPTSSPGCLCRVPVTNFEAVADAMVCDEHRVIQCLQECVGAVSRPLYVFVWFFVCGVTIMMVLGRHPPMPKITLTTEPASFSRPCRSYGDFCSAQSNSEPAAVRSSKPLAQEPEPVLANLQQLRAHDLQPMLCCRRNYHNHSSLQPAFFCVQAWPRC